MSSRAAAMSGAEPTLRIWRGGGAEFSVSTLAGFQETKMLIHDLTQMISLTDSRHGSPFNHAVEHQFCSALLLLTTSSL